MNLIDIEDRLKDLSDQQLMQQMQRPDGTAPQFLVMSELKRRKEMRDRAPAPETTTVKDDLVQQGIASVANQMAPQDGIPRFSSGVFVNPRNRAAFFRTPVRRSAAIASSIGQSIPTNPDGSPIQRTLDTTQAQMRAASGDVYPFSGNYNQTDAEMYTGREGPVFSRQPLTSANIDAAKFMPFDGAASPEITNPQNVPPASNPNAELKRRSSILGGYSPGQGMPSGTGGEFDGEVNAATDYDRALNQIMSAPSSAAPAAPPTNYYEGIEKKLAALQEAETGPDTGMALLRAGLGIAQAGGEGKSTAAAIGAGGIAGLDAYEADKKAKQARQMQLMGVESQLAGAKTQQAYNQQKLALDARMRDNQDKMLQLKGLGMTMQDKRLRDLAATQNDLQYMGLQLKEQKINLDADFADRKLRQMVEEGKIKGDYYEALTDKANRGDSLDRYINATPEVRELILPILRKNSASLQDDIGKTAGELMLDMAWVSDTKDALRQQLKREPSLNDVIRVARQNAMSLYGQGGGAPQGPRDLAGIRR